MLQHERVQRVSVACCGKPAHQAANVSRAKHVAFPLALGHVSRVGWRQQGFQSWKRFKKIGVVPHEHCQDVFTLAFPASGLRNCHCYVAIIVLLEGTRGRAVHRASSLRGAHRMIFQAAPLACGASHAPGAFIAARVHAIYIISFFWWEQRTRPPCMTAWCVQNVCGIHTHWNTWKWLASNMVCS